MSEDGALELIQKARAGQSQAARVLVERLMPVVQARVQRRLARTGGRIGAYDRDDLVQEISGRPGEGPAPRPRGL